MEAYRHACVGYSQQLFMYKNQDLVRSGYFGMFVPFSGMTGSAVSGVEGECEEDALLAHSQQQKQQPPMPSSLSSLPPIAPTSSSTALIINNNSSIPRSLPFTTAGSPSFTLPIKIDPEAEKRLALLRKKIHQSEYTREQLETEYLSLRAHYVHLSQLVRKTRAYEMLRWKLLRELIERRGKVLAALRVKCAVGKDVEKVMRWRRERLLKEERKKQEKEKTEADSSKNGEEAKGAECTPKSSAGEKSNVLGCHYHINRIVPL